jgi:hypothetical protein
VTRVSSLSSDFNFDFGVACTDEQIAAGPQAQHAPELGSLRHPRHLVVGSAEAALQHWKRKPPRNDRLAPPSGGSGRELSAGKAGAAPTASAAL